MDLLRLLADPGPVAKFQHFCGVEYEKPLTCDQQTQTRMDSSYSNDIKEADSVVNQETVSIFDNTITAHDKESNGSNLQPRSRILADKSAEFNNNVNKLANGYSARFSKDDGHITNGYHIIEKSQDYRKSDILQCNEGSSDVSVVNGEDVLRESVDSCRSPVVRIKYKSLLYLAKFGAFLGNELFYLTFFPFIIWNMDSLVVRQVSMLWCVVMYLGQATKDYLRWPRPQCPPVIRLETHYSQEYSMPSTHAMAGTAIPLYLAYLAVHRYQVPIYVAVVLALMWFSVTCWSRLYLGVHTILDLIAGFVYAILIFFTFLGYVEGYDLYQQTHPFGALALLFTALALCTVFYPSQYKDSSKGDAVQIVSSYGGLGIGSWLGYQLGYFHESEASPPYFIIVPTLSWCAMSFLRFITGVGVIGFLHTVTRWGSIRFYSYIYGLDEPDKTHPGVMTAYKFTTYTLVGVSAALLAPLIHIQLGIQRPAMFYEVL